VIGLDIGTTAVKAAWIHRKGNRFIVAGLARAGIDGASSSDDIAEKTSAAIHRCVYVLGRRRDVVCGLSGPDVAVRTFELPALPEKQLASAVELEAAQVCPFDLHEGAVAYQVLRGPSAKARRHAHQKGRDKPERTTGILAAAKKGVIERLRELCTRGETHCVTMDVDGLALLNCLEACAIRKPTETALVLNVGSAYTNLAIVSDDELPFVLDIACAGAGIVDHLARSTKAGREAVAAALEGSEESGIAPETLRSGLREACAPLAERVLQTIRYQGARKSGPGVDRVLVCGGLAQAQPVIETLGDLLDRQVEQWDPLISLPCARAVRKSGLAERGPLFAVALGLAMRSVRDVQD